MADFPATSPLPPVISSGSVYAFGGLTVWHTLLTPASATWPSNNLGIFVPFSIPCPYLVRTMFSYNGATASGNLDLGIYSVDGSLIVSAGSTAQSGTSTLQIVDVTDTLLQAGRYYMALSSSTTAATFVRSAYGVLGQQSGGAVQAASQVPLANLPTFASPANSYVPLFGMSTLTSY